MHLTPEQRESVLYEAKQIGINQVCKKYQISKSQFYTWQKRYDEAGIQGLERKKRSDAGIGANHGQWVNQPVFKDLRGDDFTIPWLRRMKHRFKDQPSPKFIFGWVGDNGTSFRGYYHRRTGVVSTVPYFGKNGAFSNFKIVQEGAFAGSIRDLIERCLQENQEY